MRASSCCCLGMVAAIGLAATAAGTTGPGRAAGPGLAPLAEDAWDQARARHLLFRAGFGGSPAEVEKLRALGLRKAVESLVAYYTQPDLDLPPLAGPASRDDPAELSKLTPQERQKRAQQRRRDDQQHMARVRRMWVQRMIQSPRPLQEKLTLFWHGHFATEYRTVRNGQAMLEQNQRFRKHAAGNFGKLLHAIIRDPAMLRYLDNNRNTKGRPNENLAREIMELFAMGLDQGYTENDIKEGARALTGHTFDPRTWEYRYTAARHDTGRKTIFGQTGNWNGDQFVDLILEQPATPRFIARKLFTFFAHEEPATETVERLAAVLRDSNFELAPMLENLFTSAEFYSPRAMATQIKSPVQLVVSAHRELAIRDGNYTHLAQAIRIMGQDLFQPPSVKGWDGGRTWINANRIFLRYNAVTELLESVPRTGGQRGLDVVGTVLCGKAPKSKAEVVDYLTRTCLAAPLSAAKRQALIDYLEPLPPPPEWQGKQLAGVNARLTALLALLMSSPEYQMT